MAVPADPESAAAQELGPAPPDLEWEAALAQELAQGLAPVRVPDQAPAQDWALELAKELERVANSQRAKARASAAAIRPEAPLESRSSKKPTSRACLGCWCNSARRSNQRIPSSTQ